jgi:ferredoxin
MIAPDSFELDDIEGHASAVSEDVPAEHEDAVREAAQSCPEQAILIGGDRQRGAAGRSGSPSDDTAEASS